MSQQQAKRQKIEENAEHGQSWILKEPLIQDLIFQHLSAKDVKNLFLVSTFWNEAAALSGVAMSKLVLVVQEKQGEPAFTRRNATSTIRCYSSAKLSLRYQPSVQRAFSFLEPSKSSLEELTIVNRPGPKMNYSDIEKFTKVRKAVFTNSSQQTVQDVIGKLENLQALEL